MADAFTQLGISRRPADVLFGRPDLSGGTAAGWSSVAVAQDEADRAARDEEQARADARAAAARNREAEVAADQFVRTDPSAREKFLGDNPAVVGSKRFNEIAQYQKMQPSYADTRLANSVAMKIADPDARQVFHTAVQNGVGTLAAKDEADRFIAKRTGMAKLTAAGIHPTEASRIADEEGYSPDIINHHVYKAKGETVFHRDPEAQALEKYYHTLKDRAAIEAKDPLNISGGPSPETAAEMRRVGELLGGLYKAKSPLASKTPAAPVPTTSAEAKAALLKKLGLVKP